MASLKVGRPSPIKGKYRTRKESICEYCGDVFWGKPYKANRFCSFTCYVDYRRHDAKVISRFRSSKEYLKWARLIKARDRRCVYCGLGGKLIAHHKIAVRKDVTKALDLNNGEAVCYSCHNILHNNILNIINASMKQDANSGKPRTGNPEPSRGESSGRV